MKFNVHTGCARKRGVWSPWDKGSAQPGLPLELALFLKLHAGSITDFKKIIPVVEKKSTCPIKTKKLQNLFKVGVILTVFFQTSWNVVPSGQQSHCHRGLLCIYSMKPHLWTSFTFINYRISRTNNPNLTATNLFVSSFWEMMQFNVEWLLFQLTPASSGPTDHPSRQTKAWSKPTEGEQGLSALFPKGCCSGLERVSMTSQWGSRLHYQWPKAGWFCNRNLWKAMWMGTRRCCWSAAQTLVCWGQRRMRAIRQQETPKRWTGPHTHQVQWLG